MTTQAITKQQHECLRCSGTGHFLIYSHVAGGTCFACGGTGTVDFVQKQYTATKTTFVAKPSKTIHTEELGEIIIEKLDSGKGFEARTTALGLGFQFSVTHGIVDTWAVPQGYRQHGITKESQMNAILQQHLKK